MFKSLNLKPYYGAFLAFAGAICFSTKAVIVKLGYTYDMDALSFLMLRMIFSLPFFLWMGYSSNNQQSHKVSGKEWIYIFILGFIGYYLSSLFDFIGLQYITAGLERLIVFVYPTIVVLISAIIFRKKLTKKIFIALFLTYAGILIVFGEGIEGEQKNIIAGSLFVFASAVTYAFYLVGSGNLIPKIGAMKYTAYAMSISCIAVIGHYLLVYDFEQALSYPSEVYIYGVLMAIVSTVIPSICLAASIKLIGSDKASIIGSVGPVSTIILANIFLGEPIVLIQIIGTVFVLAGVLIVSLENKKETRPKMAVNVKNQQ